MAAIGGLELVVTPDAANPVAGDLRVSGTRFAKLTSFGEAIAQAVRVELLWWRGDWFLDTSKGVPYVEELLRRGVSEVMVRQILRRHIKSVDGVKDVVDMTVTFNRRTRFADVTNVVVVTTEDELVPIDNTRLGGGVR